MGEVKRNEAIAHIWAKFALQVGTVFMAICMVIGIMIMSFMGSR